MLLPDFLKYQRIAQKGNRGKYENMIGGIIRKVYPYRAIYGAGGLASTLGVRLRNSRKMVELGGEKPPRNAAPSVTARVARRESR